MERMLSLLFRYIRKLDSIERLPLTSTHTYISGDFLDRICNKKLDRKVHLIPPTFIFLLTAYPGCTGKGGGVRKAIRAWHYYTLVPQAEENSTPSASRVGSARKCWALRPKSGSRICCAKVLDYRLVPFSSHSRPYGAFVPSYLFHNDD